jgi:outer membrane protein TolC
VRKDLDVRREQVQFGLQAAQAQMSVAAWETLYAVTRNYWSAVYAQEQLAMADEALDPEKVGGLRWLRKTVDDIYQEAGRKDLREWSVTGIDVVIEGVVARKIEAEVGMNRAMAAMREAMGVPCDYPIVIPKDVRMPWIEISICKADVVAAAQARRGEITQAMVFKEVSGLEVQAQGKAHPWSMQGETFASGSDIHVISVPMQMANGEYRPGAVGPEMPAKLAGYRQDRVNQASLLADRAGSVVEKTRQLMILQAEDAYWKFERATREVEANRKALKIAETTKDKIADEFRPVAPLGARPNLDDLMGAGLKSAQFKFSINQARYERLLALTYLERVTAGGVNPGFDGPLPIDDPKQREEKKTDGKNGMEEKKPPDKEPVRRPEDATPLSQGRARLGTGETGNPMNR